MISEKKKKKTKPADTWIKARIEVIMKNSLPGNERDTFWRRHIFNLVLSITEKVFTFYEKVAESSKLENSSIYRPGCST